MKDLKKLTTEELKEKCELWEKIVNKNKKDYDAVYKEYISRVKKESYKSINYRKIQCNPCCHTCLRYDSYNNLCTEIMNTLNNDASSEILHVCDKHDPIPYYK